MSFNIKPSICLVVPIRSGLIRIRKYILLDWTVLVVKYTLKFNLCSCTCEMFTWFHLLKNKYSSSFLNFDAKNYSTSISPILFNKALIPVRKLAYSTSREINIILSAKETHINFNNKLQCLASMDDLFGIIMDP